MPNKTISHTYFVLFHLYNIYIYCCIIARYQVNRIDTEASKCLSNVRFGLMMEQELTQIRDSEVVKRCPIGQQLVSKGYHYHLDSKKGGPF